jgi:hypothetical protein
MRDQTPDTVVICITCAENGIRIISFTAHPDGVLGEVLVCAMTAVYVRPGLGVNAGYFVGAGANHGTVFGVEGLDFMDKSAALQGAHVGETSDGP